MPERASRGADADARSMPRAASCRRASPPSTSSSRRCDSAPIARSRRTRSTSAFDLRLAPIDAPSCPSRTPPSPRHSRTCRRRRHRAGRRWTIPSSHRPTPARAAICAYTAMLVAAIAATPFAGWAFVALAMGRLRSARPASLSSDAMDEWIAFLWIAGPALRERTTRSSRARCVHGPRGPRDRDRLVKQMYLPLSAPRILDPRTASAVAAQDRLRRGTADARSGGDLA